MPDKPLHRLRLRLPSGAEMEAEGSPEFVAGERQEFTALWRPRSLPKAPGAPPESAEKSADMDPRDAILEPDWGEILEAPGKNIQLRAKLGGGGTEREACLVLIAASRSILKTPKPTAAQIARWLRLSGYPVARVDRALQAAIDQGDILASGSRRARRYELSGPGLAKAFNLAYQLKRLIQPD